MSEPTIPAAAVEAVKREVAGAVLKSMLQIEGKTRDPELRWQALRAAVQTLRRTEGRTTHGRD